MNSQNVIEMSGISKAFSGVQVLKTIDFQLRRGEVHALMGENGAGKSTLMKILTGIYKADQGTIVKDGEQVTIKSPKEAESMGIAVIHQELNNISHLTVAENMFLGRELTYGKSTVLKTKEMKAKTKEYLSRLGVDIDPDTVTGKLSVGRQQLVEIARALATDAEIIIMDEPTAALTDREIHTLFEVIEQLTKDQITIVYISHRMEEIFTICDRITVLRDGQYIGTETIKNTSLDDIVKMMVGRELGERYPEREPTFGNERLRIEGLSTKNELRNVHLTVREGEIVALAGLMGAGRTEIAEALFGARPITSGQIYVDGKKVSIRKPTDAINEGIGFVTEDRKSKGLILGDSIRDNMSLASLSSISRFGIVQQQKENAIVEELMQKLRVKASNMNQKLKALSGGNQQKVVLGKWLATHPKLLILDEPTRGVDIGAKKEIYQIMNELTSNGVAILMISSELPEVLGMSDRIIVVHEGTISAEFSKQDANQENIMHAATGGVKA
ncbi:sugar ABC transporter ATP-binding protein [Aureibacillus halotolerans]|uniref:Ribose ABC transporter ATP-binding protein n=1 Tax=Aureibacillus halotolerans TaxID=1508390 RepID=A0A4R6TLD7_9BACI|nr:sugar ABC transporter ATP-binding protein [Aureibacillus halotolerans]TDQ32164.1 ribose ABC transporter ATP-binding protein [Aureibacillus halotolerans]